ncbi:class II aldolase/adducin family protein [Limimaricola sp. AA108-03]|uniref:class II aldolase/adducin family protein n=1 Tax=Limimaricola sp. AA108-03 TaxID=3425945 RepID=UPI003D7702B3
MVQKRISVSPRSVRRCPLVRKSLVARCLKGRRSERAILVPRPYEVAGQGARSHFSSFSTPGRAQLFVLHTESSSRALDPARPSRVDAAMAHVGHRPIKEMPLHRAFDDTRSGAGAIVHLHSCRSVALSMVPGSGKWFLRRKVVGGQSLRPGGMSAMRRAEHAIHDGSDTARSSNLAASRMAPIRWSRLLSVG